MNLLVELFLDLVLSQLYDLLAPISKMLWNVSPFATVIAVVWFMFTFSHVIKQQAQFA